MNRSTLKKTPHHRNNKLNENDACFETAYSRREL